MAFDKVIDSTKLNACLTAEANAIRAKTGGSSQLAYDYANSKGFADAIAAIPTGGGGGRSIPSYVGDGKTYLYIYIPEGTPSSRREFQVYVACTMSNGVTINWGDGTVETSTSTESSYSHIYMDPGNYTITLTVNSGTIQFGGGSGKPIYGNITQSSKYYIRDYLIAVEFGNKVTSIGGYTLTSIYNLVWVWISDSVLSFDSPYPIAWLDSIYEIHLLATTPPTLNVTGFPNMGAGYTIYVPYSADHSILQSYRSATNWSNFGITIQEEPQ